MQVVSPFFINRPPIKSTIDIRDSSLLLSLPSRNFENNNTDFRNNRKINIDTIVHYGILHKTVFTPINTTKSGLILRPEKQGLCNIGCRTNFEESYKDFMNEDSKMDGANCKRYLHNKLGDRKRRRPDSAILGSSEVEESVLFETLVRPKQTPRQSVQRHLTSATICLEKPNKTEPSVSTCGSQKVLRSNKHDLDECFKYNESYPSNSNKTDVENLSDIDVDVSNNIYDRNSDNSKISVNEFENKESKNVTNTNFKDKLEKNLIVNNKKSEDEEKAENLEENSSNKSDNNSYSNNNAILLDKSIEKLYQSDATHLDEYLALERQNGNANNNVFINATTLNEKSLDITVNTTCKLEEKSASDNNINNDVTRIEANNETTNLTTALLNESVSHKSQCPLFSINDNNETQNNYENNFNNASNSLCVENNLSSNSCLKDSLANRKNSYNNESKPELLSSQTKLSNTAMKLPQTSSKITQQECDVFKSQINDEQCHHFENDVNTDDSIKTELTLSTNNASRFRSEASDVTSISTANPKFENLSLKQNAIADDLKLKNIAYKKDDDNKQENKDLRQYNTDSSQNINIYSISNSSLENSLKESRNDNNISKPDVEFSKTQSTDDRHCNDQQLEKHIIDNADKVYTQIEEQYHQQQNSTPLSPDYVQTINNQQQQLTQQDQEEVRHRHDLNLTHPQDSSQQHSSIHQHQQSYSSK